MLKRGYDEGGGLSGAIICAREDIALSKGDGNGLLLDRFVGEEPDTILELQKMMNCLICSLNTSQLGQGKGKNKDIPLKTGCLGSATSAILQRMRRIE